MSKSKVLFCLSGSISGFKACQVISQLVQEGHEVQVVTTQSALKFIGPATLEGLTNRQVLSDLWQPGFAMDHISLTRWADYAVLCPASANTLAKIALGLADDLISTLALAWPMQKAFHIFPAMNTVMLNAQPTQSHLQNLSARGFQVAATGAGSLACGEVGEGRLLEPSEILKHLRGRLSEPKKRGRLLITSGATREPIDGIRFLSNVSTGQTGATLSDELSDLGWQVTYLFGSGAVKSDRAAHSLGFTEFKDLERKLRIELDQRDYAAIIHCAAVSDYSVENAKPATKLSSDGPLDVQFRQNPKLLPRLKQFSRSRNLKVIGFKLTLGATKDETQTRAQELLSPEVDAVVGNDWSQVDRDRGQHPGQFLTGHHQTDFLNLPELSTLIHHFLSEPSMEVGK